MLNMSNIASINSIKVKMNKIREVLNPLNFYDAVSQRNSQ